MRVSIKVAPKAYPKWEELPPEVKKAFEKEFDRVCALVAKGGRDADDREIGGGEYVHPRVGDNKGCRFTYMYEEQSLHSKLSGVFSLDPDR